jgi:hypothetical protein
MSSEAFILNAVQSAEPAEAIRLAVEGAGLIPGRIQEALFGYEPLDPTAEAREILHKAGLTCPAARVWPSLRALFAAAQSIVSEDVELAVVVSEDGGVAEASVVSAPEPIGRWNLVPRARVAARSVGGMERALRSAGIAAEDVAISKTGGGLHQARMLLEELEAQKAQWGALSSGELVLLLERV